MNQNGYCQEESAVSVAARSGEWSSFLETHLAGCAACREIAETSRWMRALAENSNAEPNLRDAGLVWWRAQLSEKQAKVERMHKALDWTEIISAGILGAGLAAWAAANWQAIEGAAGGFWTGLWPQLWDAAFSAADSTPVVFWSLAVVVSLVAIALAFPIPTEE
jgi:hypothetical protein